MTTSPTPKRAKTAKDVPYDLIYWPGVPGRGEPIRLVFEEAGASYTDTATTSAVDPVLAQISADNLGDAANPPVLAPPILRHGDLTIAQLPNILLYLGQSLGLAPSFSGEGDDGEGAKGTVSGAGAYHVNHLALTALDGFSNETHDTHHPIAVGLVYEDQKDEAIRRASDYKQNRLPKFLGYFERVLRGDASGEGPWLYGGRLTYADIVLFQTLDGVTFAFPRAVEKLRDGGEYDRVFELYEAVKARPRIKEYLVSERRQAYSNGLYRRYPELDDDEEEDEETDE